MGMDPAGQQVTDTGTAGVIARPPLLFLAALLLGFASDRLLPLPFAVPGVDLVHWISRRLPDPHRSCARSRGYSQLLPGGDASTHEPSPPARW